MSHPIPASDTEFVAFQSALTGLYFLERELGRGGMGIVYLAREVRLDRPVAIKVLPPSLAARPELRERFLREAKTAAQLSHPNIVPIFRVDETRDFVYFAMAFVDGETLGERIRSRGALSPREVARMLQEVGWALAYAHARGIVHRDVKPDNILLEKGTGRALVTDFGIAHVSAASGLTSEGMVMGTAHYMSPEQAAGERIDGRSDLYSLGVVAYLALAGRLPFDAPTMPALLAMHLTQPAPPLPTTAPRHLADAIACCLKKSPGERFATGEALAEAVAEQARPSAELPVPLRVWLTRTDPVRPLYVGWSGMFGFAAVLGTVTEMVSPDNANGILIAWALALAPAIPMAFFRLTETRRLLRSGYTLDDMRFALRQHLQQQRDEIAFVGREPSPGGRVLRGLTYLSLVGFAAAMAALIVSPDVGTISRWGPLAAWLGFGSVAGGVLGLTYPGRRIGGEEKRGEWRLRFWNSRVGQLFTNLAAYRLRGRVSAQAGMHRPTELVIGLAADALFESLPSRLKGEMKELPDILRRLTDEAGRLRGRIDKLNASLAELGASDGPAGGAAGGGGGGGTPGVEARYSGSSGASALAAQRQAVVGDLRAQRDAATDRLGTIVTTLESIRLDLLRLQTGATGPESITTMLEAARRVQDEVDLALSARAQADALVGSPKPLPKLPSPPEGSGAAAR
ncbi:MAG TPA: serine/threonine-protein kinase [Gemmatimonadaceae bacterium]|nr:serine/threonine-protein kinase [Gemmatimonadaceae bacterium]